MIGKDFPGPIEDGDFMFGRKQTINHCLAHAAGADKANLHDACSVVVSQMMQKMEADVGDFSPTTSWPGDQRQGETAKHPRNAEHDPLNRPEPFSVEHVHGNGCDEEMGRRDDCNIGRLQIPAPNPHRQGRFDLTSYVHPERRPAEFRCCEQLQRKRTQ